MGVEEDGMRQQECEHDRTERSHLKSIKPFTQNFYLQIPERVRGQGFSTLGSHWMENEGEGRKNEVGKFPKEIGCVNFICNN